MRTASTRVPVDGVPGRQIHQAHGLHQGGAMSPQFSMIAMEVFMLLACRAAEEGLVSPIGNCKQVQRLLVYMDMMSCGLWSWQLTTWSLWENFRSYLEVCRGSRWTTGRHLLRWSTKGIMIESWFSIYFVAQSLTFFYQIIGIAAIGLALTRAQWQLVLEKAVQIILFWQISLIARFGCLVLVKEVMPARLVLHLLVIVDSISFLQEVDKSLRGVFWVVKDRENSDQCPISWNQTYKPLVFAGLWVKNFGLRHYT
jgi:hypothetical protein